MKKMLTPKEIEKVFGYVVGSGSFEKSNLMRGIKKGKINLSSKKVQLKEGFIVHPQIPDFWSEADARQMNKVIRGLENEANLKLNDYQMPDCHYFGDREIIGKELYSWMEQNCRNHGLPSNKRKKVLEKIAGLCLARKMYSLN